jgi:pyruvate,water dikinase
MRAFGAAMIERRRAPLAGLSSRELLDEVRAVTNPGFLGVRRMFASLILAMAAFGVARRAFRSHPQAAGLLAVGIRNNPTTQISVAVERLTDAARPQAAAFLATGSTQELFERLEESTEGRAWMDALAEFLDWNGQRCPKEFDLAVPRWSEDPSMILDLVRAGLREPPKEGVGARLERLGRERREAVAAAVASAPAWKRPLLRRAAERAERHLPLREAGKHYLLMALARVREVLLEVSARLAADGVLAERDDAFFLELSELDALVDGAPGRIPDVAGVIAERRARHARFEAEPAPDYVRSDGVPVRVRHANGAPSGDGLLRGTGVSTRRATGTVRILRTPDPGALREGEVLVVRFADPGWTPLFPRAAALVMEVGGVMCHAAVVARELGIPAVFGVAGATERLRDGDEVEVDADAGTVRPLRPASSE